MRRSYKILFFILIITAMCSTFLLYAMLLCYRPIARILLYHSITENKSATGIPSIERALFERQLNHLLKHGYTTVFLENIVDHFKEGKVIPERWVSLTFDGGYEDFYTIVYPLLKQYRFKATVFVITSTIGEEGALTWDELKEMQRSGLVEVGSHSDQHLSPTCIAQDAAMREKVVSKALLEEKLGSTVDLFAYPFGRLNIQVKDLVRAAGYKGAVGIVYRLGDYGLRDRYNLRRVYVSNISRFPLVFRFMLSRWYLPTRALALKILNIETPRDGECDMSE